MSENTSTTVVENESEDAPFITIDWTQAVPAAKKFARIAAPAVTGIALAVVIRKVVKNASKQDTDVADLTEGVDVPEINSENENED